MNKKNAILAFGLLVASSAGYCFEGFSAGVNANFANASTELSGGVLVLGAGGENSQFASLQGAYGFAMDGDIIVTIGGTYGLGDVKSGKLAIGSATVSLKAKDLWSVYVEPGMKFGSSTLVYGKIAYAGMTGNMNITGVTTTGVDFKGWGLGAGVRVKMNKTTYGQVEFSQTKYDNYTESGTTYKPNTTVGTVGIGMHF